MTSARVEIKVEVVGIYSFKSSFGYRTVTNHIYKMADESGKVYVWKTTSCLHIEVEIQKEDYVKVDYLPINKGDKSTIKATINGESEYNGEHQTKLTRVKVIERTYKVETYEERMARIEREKENKAEEQRNSLEGKDFIWRMTYKQYKEDYADCETVENSFERFPNRPSTSEVIVREGRLKNSGVRGEHFRGFQLVDVEGKSVVYRAVSEENAIRRAEKEFGGKWEVTKIY